MAGGRYIVNGAHEGSKLQELLDSFIKRFVLCSECENPETDLVRHAHAHTHTHTHTHTHLAVCKVSSVALQYPSSSLCVCVCVRSHR